MEAKIEFVHALAICFNAHSIDTLERESTVEPLVISVCRRDGADVSTGVNHEAFTGITLMNVKHAASRRFTRRRRPRFL